jgi:ribonuclease HII
MRTFSEHERQLFRDGRRLIAGVDEAGRGPLAGPVVAAAVIFPQDLLLEGIGDSKALSAPRRELLAGRIREAALGVGIGMADHDEIDALNILAASILAMHRAVAALPAQPDFLLVDGNRFHHPSIPFATVVRGDATRFSIAAASIIAKVHRDALMEELDRHYPGYGFARNKGYPTALHIEALRSLGRSPVHRRTFVVKRLVEQGTLFEGRE